MFLFKNMLFLKGKYLLEGVRSFCGEGGKIDLWGGQWNKREVCYLFIFCVMSEILGG